MIHANQIPNEVVIAAREAWLLSDVNVQEDWRSAIAAALNAWPDVVDTNPNNIKHLVLQFKENQDD